MYARYIYVPPMFYRHWDLLREWNNRCTVVKAYSRAVLKLVKCSTRVRVGGIFLVLQMTVCYIKITLAFPHKAPIVLHVRYGCNQWMSRNHSPCCALYRTQKTRCFVSFCFFFTSNVGGILRLFLRFVVFPSLFEISNCIVRMANKFILITFVLVQLFLKTNQVVQHS